MAPPKAVPPAPPKGVPPDPAKPKTPLPPVQPPKTPSTLRPPKITCPFKLPSSEEVDQNSEENQGNTFWRFLTGLDAIKGLEGLSARMSGLYMAHVDADRKLNGKWKPRIQDTNHQIRTQK